MRKRAVRYFGSRVRWPGMSKLNWRRPVHVRAGKQTEDRKHHSPINAPLARDRRQRARAALADAEARTAEPESITIAEWPHSRNGETLRVYLMQFRGTAYVHARRFYRDEATGDFLPGKGLGISVANLPALVRALSEATIRARELGFLPKGADE